MSEKEDWAGESPLGGACYCVGPQNGQPKCPCLLRIERERVAAEKHYNRLLDRSKEINWDTPKPCKHCKGTGVQP